MYKHFFCTVLSILIATTISAQPIKRYEGKMKPHTSLTKFSKLLHSDDTGSGYYEYYEVDGGRILNGDYYLEVEHYGISTIVKGKFVNGSPEDQWTIYDLDIFGLVVDAMTFTCHQGKLYGPISIYHTNIYQMKFDGEIYDDILVGDFSLHIEHNFIDVHKTSNIEGQFDDMGRATGIWTSSGENGGLPLTYTTSFEKGVLRKIKVFDESTGESNEVYNNDNEIRLLGNKDYIIIDNSVHSLDIGYPSETKYGKPRPGFASFGSESISDLGLVFAELSKVCPLKAPFRKEGASYDYEGTKLYYNELQKQYIDEYKESIRSYAFPRMFWNDTDSNETQMLDEIVQSVSQRIAERVKGTVRYDLYVNSDGCVDSLVNIRIFDCKKPEIVLEAMKMELQDRVKESNIKFKPYMQTVPKTEVRVPVNFIKSHSSYFNNKK